MQKRSKISISLLLIISFFNSSCAIFKTRKPASARDNSLSEIYNDILAQRSLINSNSVACHTEYERISSDLFNTAGQNEHFENSNINYIDQDIQTSFETRIALKEALANFEQKNTDDLSCFLSIKKVFKTMRYLEDYLIEIHMEKTTSTPINYVNLTGEFPYFLINSKFKNEFKSYEDLTSGDVILALGNTYPPNAMTRITDGDYQFSHLSFAYRDPSTNQLSTSESHIEIGSVVAPIIDHINEKNVRSVVYRYKDKNLAHEASKAIYQRVKEQQDSGHNIEYDFAMNFKDDSKLFAAEIVYSGFKIAIPESDFLPKFKSHFSSGMNSFLNIIGIPVTDQNLEKLESFTPGDLQFDPNFELVAEWRNPKKLEEARFKDFILNKIFDLMKNEKYQIDPKNIIDSESKEFWLLRRSPLVKHFLDKNISLSMNSGQIEIFMALDKIGEAFYKNLELRAIEYDQPMTPNEIYKAIDEFIEKDKDLYEKYKKGQPTINPSFHLWFHP